MITNGNEWRYLVAKQLSVLIKGITSNHFGDTYYLNYLHSFRTKNKLKKHANAC